MAATSFSSTQPAPSTQRRTMRAGTPATTQRSGTSPRTTAPAATTTCSPICAPGRMTALAPSQLPEPMRTGGLGRPLAPDRLDRVLVGVVLVRDVDVGTGLDVVADHDLPVADDVRAPPDEAAAADGDDRVGRHLLTRRHAGRDGGAGPDDRLGPDVDQVLVVDGALGEEQAGAGAHAARSAARGGRRARSRRARRPPSQAGVHQPGQRPPQRCRGGSGPSSRRNGRWCRGRPVDTGARTGCNSGARRVRLRRPCAPPDRTVAPSPGPLARPERPLDRRQFLQLSALGAVGFAGRSPAPRKAPSTRRPCPAQARRHLARVPAVVDTHAAERRHRADGALADRRERQAGHARTGSATTTSPSTRSRASPARSARCPATTSRCSSTRRRAPCRSRPTGWATTRASAAAWSWQTRHRRRPGSRPRPVVTPGIGTVTCPWSPTLTLNITKDWLPGCYLLEARRQRRRGAVRPAHHPRRRLHGVVRVPEQRHDLAGLQPLGQLQPLLRSRRRRAVRSSPTAPAPCPSTAPTRRPGPRARPTSSATSSRCSSTSRASGST